MGYTEKLNKILDTKSRLKNSINYLGGDITNETTFRNYTNDFDEIYDFLPKGEEEGSIITPTNIRSGKIKIEPEGNTSQKSTQGYQLFVYPYYENTVTRDGITFTVKSDGTIHVQGTATAKTNFTLRNRDLFLNIVEGETYTLVASGLGIVDSTVWLDTAGQTGNFLDKWLLQASSNYATAVAQSKDKKPLIKITVENGATINTDIQILLYKGSYDSSKEYEPYTNGASPNPDYPQEIKVVKGNNNVVVRGLNLLPYKNTTQTRDGLTFTNHGDGTFTINGTATKQTIYCINAVSESSIVRNMKLESTSYRVSVGQTMSNSTFFVQLAYKKPDGTREYVSVATDGGTINNLTIQDIDNNAGFGLIIREGTSFDNLLIKPMLQLATTSYNFEEYIEPIEKEIDLGTLELCKIDDYQDYIYKNNNKWYKKEYISKVILNGSEENWRADNNNKLYGLNLSNCKLNTSTSSSQGLCDKFIVSGLTQTRNFQQYFAIYGGSTNTVSVWFNNRNKTLEEWKTWVSNNNLKVYHQLENPTDIEITDTTLINQLEELNRTIILPDGTITIETESDTNNAQMIIKATGIKK